MSLGKTRPDEPTKVSMPRPKAQARTAAKALGSATWPVTFTGGYRVDGTVIHTEADQLIATVLLARGEY